MSVYASGINWEAEDQRKHWFFIKSHCKWINSLVIHIFIIRCHWSVWFSAFYSKGINFHIWKKPTSNLRGYLWQNNINSIYRKQVHNRWSMVFFNEAAHEGCFVIWTSVLCLVCTSINQHLNIRCRRNLSGFQIQPNTVTLDGIASYCGQKTKLVRQGNHLWGFTICCGLQFLIFLSKNAKPRISGP